MSVNFDAPGAPAPEMPSPLGHMPLPKNGDDIALNVDTMRDYRNHLIQTQEQLQLVYEMSAGWSEGEI
jgi:protein tyrosine phosphatase